MPHRALHEGGSAGAAVCRKRGWAANSSLFGSDVCMSGCCDSAALVHGFKVPLACLFNLRHFHGWGGTTPATPKIIAAYVVA